MGESNIIDDSGIKQNTKLADTAKCAANNENCIAKVNHIPRAGGGERHTMKNYISFHWCNRHRSRPHHTYYHRNEYKNHYYGQLDKNNLADDNILVNMTKGTISTKKTYNAL